MESEALFLNGLYRNVLKGILAAQQRAPHGTFYLQPHGTRTIVGLKKSPPTSQKPVILYASTTRDLQTVSYSAQIIGWKDKGNLDPAERQRIDREIREAGYNPDGLFGLEEGMINLIFIRSLVRLDPTFNVTELNMTRHNRPYPGTRTTSGLWSYVDKRKAPS